MAFIFLLPLETHGSGCLKSNKHGIGYWKDDKKDGKGAFIFQKNEGISEKKYIGQFVNDEIKGKGKMYYKNGEIYTGMMENKIKEGYGKMIYKNGDIYIPYLKNNNQS